MYFRTARQLPRASLAASGKVARLFGEGGVLWSTLSRDTSSLHMLQGARRVALATLASHVDQGKDHSVAAVAAPLMVRTENTLLRHHCHCVGHTRVVHRGSRDLPPFQCASRSRALRVPWGQFTTNVSGHGGLQLCLSGSPASSQQLQHRY